VADPGVSFTPPPYPYERLDHLKELASRHEGGPIDASIGTPIDPPPDFVVAELAQATGARGYPPSAGTALYRESCAEWLARRFAVEVGPHDVAACVGTKEFVATLAGFLRLRWPQRDTVLYPAISYPTYAMSATLAGVRGVAVPVGSAGLDLASVSDDDARRALVLWSNSPSNPTGALDDLAAVARWGREHDVLVASDECYAEYTWTGRPRTILESGSNGVLAVHSASKRSNLAGLRAGFYAGDTGTVAYLRAVRQHAGFMVPGPIQAAVASAYADHLHVALQRERYRARLDALVSALSAFGVEAPLPDGTFYLWCSRDGDDGWSLAAALAEAAGLVVSPGDLYGEAGANHVRVALVVSDEQVSRVVERLEAA
jgi:succinyldiaminopimelate transaminase